MTFWDTYKVKQVRDNKVISIFHRKKEAERFAYNVWCQTGTKTFVIDVKGTIVYSVGKKL